MTTETKKIEQMNTYQVVYSDGVRILDYICAANLNEAKKLQQKTLKQKTTEQPTIKWQDVTMVV